MKLMLYGSNGKGRELYDCVTEYNLTKKRWSTVEFIDDVRKEKEYYGTKVCTLEDVKYRKDIDDIECLVAVGEPVYRELMYEKLKNAGLKIATFIHPESHLSPNVIVGEGTIIMQEVVIASGSITGSNVLFQRRSILGHDAFIGDHSVISANVYTGGGITTGSRVYVGLSVSIKEGITIGDDVIAGMGSVVLRNIKPDKIVSGNPARVISDNFEKRVFNLW